MKPKQLLLTTTWISSAAAIYIPTPGFADQQALTWLEFLKNQDLQSLEEILRSGDISHAVAKTNPEAPSPPPSPPCPHIRTAVPQVLEAPRPKKPSGAELAYSHLLSSLDTMQNTFYDAKKGGWPGANDWTAAVVQTHVSGTLQALLQSNPNKFPRNDTLSNYHRIFPSIVSYFHSQPVRSILRQAYDDILWVCLGWISSVQLLVIDESQSRTSVKKPSLHYKGLSTTLEGKGSPLYREYVKPFAARAKQFYEAAEKGWDETMCKGGMVWDPNKRPYKNSITNELYISSSVEMFLYYPPHLNPDGERNGTYLSNAVRAYNWLRRINMKNEAGLIVDGYHISKIGNIPAWWDWRRWWYGKNGKVENGDLMCDQRDEGTYTYNQGVLLSGMHGLYLATGDETYLDHGHELISAVIKSEAKRGGLMRKGILEERCDSSGRCNQDGQAFKGIFFHHLTLFCDQNALISPLKPEQQPDAYLSSLHYSKCFSYHSFILSNAKAAWASRSIDTGVVGGWWSAPDASYTHSQRIHYTTTTDEEEEDDEFQYLRKRSTPSNEVFDYDKFEREVKNGEWSLPSDPTAGDYASMSDDEMKVLEEEKVRSLRVEDLNDRGRGRTVETQSSGVGVFMAAWQVVWQNGW